MGNLTPEDRLSVLEKTIESLREVVNSISNDKVPRITMERLNELMTSTTTTFDDDEISDVEAAIFDARDMAKSAEQDTRRLTCAMETHRFILVKLLKHLSPEKVAEILNETAAYSKGLPGEADRMSPRLSGLELRAFNKELDTIRSLMEG
ncbi:hypothetical protein [Acetobacter fabarum]|uniref:hypothetical protein n=1 Tax=Acetobacter fabarum TaxID=483199 RepID=UPI0039EB6DC7